MEWHRLRRVWLKNIYQTEGQKKYYQRINGNSRPRALR
jgi:hypothetical protein